MARTPTARCFKRLEGVDPVLREAYVAAVARYPTKVIVIEGVRTRERQCELYGKGRTAAELRAAGVPTKYAKPSETKVTWTMKSRHFGGGAIDFGHVNPDGGIDWETTTKYRDFAHLVLDELKKRGAEGRWGGDWDRDGKTEHGENDFVHVEIMR